MAQIEFKDYSIEVKNALKSLAYKAVEEACGELESQTKQNTVTKSSTTKNAWTHNVKASKDETTGTVGNPLENAIWEEFGTGTWALNGDGRQGYWVFVDDGDSSDSSASKNTTKSYTLKEAKKVVAILRSKGKNAYYTNGKEPRRAFWKAYTTLKNKLIKQMQDIFKGGLS